MTERQKWEDIFLEDCAEYDNKIAKERKSCKSSNTTTVMCFNCKTIMTQQQYFGGGIYWLCGKCGAKIERTGI